MQEHERVYLNLKNDISRLSLGKKIIKLFLEIYLYLKNFYFLEQNLELQKLENNQKLEK